MFSTGTQPIEYVYVYTVEIYFKELAHTIIGAGKFKIPRARHQAGNAGSSLGCNLESEMYRAGW